MTSEVSSANGTTVYTYDANGSLTTKINAGQSINCQYGYDLRNRLVSASITRMEGTAPNQPQKVDITSHYAYNADGIRTRVTQTVGDVTQKRYFLLDDGHTGYSQVFEETSSLGGSVVRSYVIGDDVLSQTVTGTTSHLLYDGHGSTRQLANGNGEITDSYAYDAYGKMLGGDPNVTDRKSATDLLYAGEQFDAGLQMEYLRARYYDASSGRFNRLDPFAGNGKDPQSLHKYAYSHCDPTNGTDPSGMMIVAFLSAMNIQQHLANMKNEVDLNVQSGMEAIIFGIQSGLSANGILATYYVGLALPYAFKGVIKLVGKAGQVIVARFNRTFADAIKDIGVPILMKGRGGVVPTTTRQMVSSSFKSQTLKRNMLSMIRKKADQVKGYVAHHLIPRDLANHSLFRRLKMDFDAGTNGIFLTGSQAGKQHVGGHPNYSSAIKRILDEVEDTASQMTNKAKQADYINSQIIDLQRSAATLLREGMEMISEANSIDTWFDALKAGM